MEYDFNYVAFFSININSYSSHAKYLMWNFSISKTYSYFYTLYVNGTVLRYSKCYSNNNNYCVIIIYINVMLIVHTLNNNNKLNYFSVIVSPRLRCRYLDENRSPSLQFYFGIYVHTYWHTTVYTLTTFPNHYYDYCYCVCCRKRLGYISYLFFFFFFLHFVGKIYAIVQLFFNWRE